MSASKVISQPIMDFDQSVQILSNASEPQAQGRLTRADYVNINVALVSLQEHGKELEALRDEVESLRSSTVPQAPAESGTE